jgi:hypothetical protein
LPRRLNRARCGRSTIWAAVQAGRLTVARLKLPRLKQGRDRREPTRDGEIFVERRLGCGT